MDETPFYYDHLQKRTIDFVGNNSITTLNTGADKSRFTVVVTIAANGESLKYYVILRGLKNVPAVFRQYPNPFPNVVVAVSQSGTMDENLNDGLPSSHFTTIFKWKESRIDYGRIQSSFH
jgi:hypothetical protein